MKLVRRRGTCDWWPKAKTPKAKTPAPPACPWCDSTDIEAEFVDNGIGMEQVTPYLCGECESSQLYPRDYEPGRTPPLTALEKRYGWHEPSLDGAKHIFEKMLRKQLTSFHGLHNTPEVRAKMQAQATEILARMREQGYCVPAEVKTSVSAGPGTADVEIMLVGEWKATH